MIPLLIVSLWLPSSSCAFVDQQEDEVLLLRLPDGSLGHLALSHPAPLLEGAWPCGSGLRFTPPAPRPLRPPPASFHL